MKKTILALAALLAAQPLAAVWTPMQFQRAERYDFVVSGTDLEDMGALSFSLDIRDEGVDEETGESLFAVTYSTTGVLTGSELAEGTAFGLLGAGGVSLTLLIVSPMTTMFFATAEFEVGHTTDLYGAGRIEVVATEEIAGREGFVCRLYVNDGGEDRLASEVVIDPDLALPLRSVTYDGAGAETARFDLVGYAAH